MSVQFGRSNLDGRPLLPEYLQKVSKSLAPYGPDTNDLYANDGVAILYRAFCTTKESWLEKQPHVLASGAVLTWCGRLDNRTELINDLSSLNANSTDVAIVAAAYGEWGNKFCSKLIGNWALAIWNPNDRSLLLAKDPVGACHLYYTYDQYQITWSTILDPIVRLGEKTFDLCEEYVAGWFSSYPRADLTPCAGVYSVPPSSSVLLRSGKRTITKYWDFEAKNKIRYRTDAEYEEHFRAVFAKAVERTLRSDKPVLAELSGGRDSSSIVCVADEIMSRSVAVTPRLDTISYYDDTEPSWNERPYFAKVEEKRGRVGWHVNTAKRDSDEAPATEPSVKSPKERFVPTPGYDGGTSPEMAKCLAAQGNRVLLTGIGGDEVMGGVPTPTAELEDLLARGRFGALAQQLKGWALQQRKPWIHLFWEVARDFLPPGLVGVPEYMRPVSWLQSGFVKRNRAAVTGYPLRTRLLGPLPSFQGNMYTLEALRRQLAVAALPYGPPFEKRYPYLDRNLLEFMYAIPREQLVRPKQRRSLMRRALAGIVPDEILNRKSKAFVARAPMAEISKDWSSITATVQDMLSASLGIVDSQRLFEVLQKARRGEESPTLRLMRTMCLEAWMKDLRALGCMDFNGRIKPGMAIQEPVQG